MKDPNKAKSLILLHPFARHRGSVTTVCDEFASRTRLNPSSRKRAKRDYNLPAFEVRKEIPGMHSVPAPEDSRWFRVAIRSFLLASMFLLHAVEARPERIPSCDACQTIQGQIDDLNKRISDLEQHKVGQFGKQGEPLKPPPQDPEVAAKISSLQQQVDALKTQLQRCEKPSPDPPPLAFRLQTAGINPPDPQIAVGHKYFAAFSTTMLAFFEKSTRTQVTSGLGFPNNNGFIDGITL
ncbi:MAG TPA: hypothetical protein VL240_11790, partial [Candidatus Binatia bacterium]|nr:hypothetical protein [Candidatus Binatia bacterium]